MLKGPEFPLGSFARGAQNPEFLAGDRYAVLGSEMEGTILWDVEAWAQLGAPIPFDTDFRPMGVAPEAKVVAGPLNGEMLVWNVDPDTWPDLACMAAGRNLTQEEWGTYGPDRDYRPTCPQWRSLG